MTRPVPLATVLALLACLTLATPARAQDAQSASPSIESDQPLTSPGFGHDVSVMVGGGFATRSYSCDQCTQGAGVSALFKLNRFVGATTAIGIEGTIARNNDGPVGNSLYSAMGVVTAYVLEHMPIYISGGLGVVVFEHHNGAYGHSGTGFGCTGRLGYDAHVLSGLSLVPYIGYVSTIGGVAVGASKQSVSTFQVGLGVALH